MLFETDRKVLVVRKAGKGCRFFQGAVACGDQSRCMTDTQICDVFLRGDAILRFKQLSEIYLAHICLCCDLTNGQILAAVVLMKEIHSTADLGTWTSLCLAAAVALGEDLIQNCFEKSTNRIILQRFIGKHFEPS